MIDEITLKRAEAAGLPAAEAHPDPPLVCFPMRAEWDMLHPPAAASAWPEPEMVNEDAPDAMGKRAVLDLSRTATSLGWSVRVTKAKGSWPSVGQKPSVARWSLAVRMARGEDRAIAVYVEDATGKTWKWGTLYRWTIGQFPDRHEKIEALRAALI